MLGAVVVGSVVSVVGALIVVVPLAELNLPVVAGDHVPGHGWPWRIDGAWAFLADLGPALSMGFLFSAAVEYHLRSRTGVRARRWPLALAAAAAGWIPVAGDRHGLLVGSTGLALLIVVVAARHWSRAARAPMHWSPLRVAATLIGVEVLAAATLSYGALHPLTVQDTGSVGEPIALRDGRSPKLSLLLESYSPLTTRVLGIDLADSQHVRVAKVQIDSERTEAPTLEGLYRPLGNPRIGRGDSLFVYLTLESAICREGEDVLSQTIRAVNVRLRVAGVVRTQRVKLPDEWHIACGA